MPNRVYLDWNATTPLRPEARSAMLAAYELIGNPSSVHAEGREARRLVEGARAILATAVGALPRNVVFTSTGTEANALALSPGLRGPSGGPVERLPVSAFKRGAVNRTVFGNRLTPLEKTVARAVERMPFSKQSLRLAIRAASSGKA